MKCPSCKKAKTSVYDTRYTTDEGRTRRRRECDDCHFRFTTVEYVEGEMHSIIKKRVKLLLNEGYTHSLTQLEKQDMIGKK